MRYEMIPSSDLTALNGHSTAVSDFDGETRGTRAGYGKTGAAGIGLGVGEARADVEIGARDVNSRRVPKISKA
jgi:hypothetical protein